MGPRDLSPLSLVSCRPIPAYARFSAALMPCRLWEASLTVKNTTSASGVALPECTTFDGT